MEPTSQLVEQEKEFETVVDTPKYSEDEQTCLNMLQKRLEYARDQKETSREEWDLQTYSQQWLNNERWANTYIPPKNNKSEISFQSGFLRVKMDALVSSIIGLNLGADIMAFDKNQVRLSALGTAMEDIVGKTNELDNDEEKKYIRISELIKQGTVFIQEVWKDQSFIEKKMLRNFDGKFSFRGWREKEMKEMERPVREVISGRSVYLGNLEKYLIEDQPFIFTLETKTYKEVEAIFKDFEMWEYVKHTLTPFSGSTNSAIITMNWTLETHPDGEVELLKYQSVQDNEYQVLINGIPMLPLGFPLPWGRRYNLDQQNLDLIRHDFSYGKSFVFKNKNIVQLFDEMTKMALLKTYKSFMPPYINISGQIIPQSALMPGKINMGIPVGALVPISPNETQGVTNSEFNMMHDIKAFIDEKSVSPTFTGSGTEGSQTATEIIEVQRQARVMLGTLIMAVSLMEKKITISRVQNIVQNWFNPVDKGLDEARAELINQYRIVSKPVNIESEGPGLRFTVPTENAMSVPDLITQEDRMTANLGVPTRITLIDPNALKTLQLIWQIEINPKDKKSSDLSKLMFSKKIQDGMALGLQFNPQYIEEQFAEVWEDDPSKLFAKGPVPGTPGAPGAMPQGKNTPGIKIPKVGIDQGQDINQSKIA